MHFSYLGLLPALATFACFVHYGHPAPFLLFLGGTATVAVYLAVTINYVPVPQATGLMLLALVDGPFVALMSTSAPITPDIFVVAIHSFLIDGISVWLIIAWLALTTDRPTPDQRVATIILVLIAVATVLSLVGPYVLAELWGQWVQTAWLSIGIVEALCAYYYLLCSDHVVRSPGTSSVYVVIFL